ncbi:MAG: NERD domain-containing protein [Gammaproteobacteria bacterium]|nr:NERD domain-containing protein [Gammaproteobacteria bacterium]MCW8911032.1 NERD domain-containing protein [Gammaproteobacteria bacterium]MCW9004538.1 NERD domain-containing protein [Gammaproteobacteria bacterium]MCW9055977.1 NERD domain-containing protein [Gammaproteobacteria bacterium]
MKQWLTEQNIESLMSLGIAGLIIIFGLYLLYTVIKQNILRHSIETKVSQLGFKQLKDIIIDDGMDGKIQIERVFLTAKGILALSSNFLTGNIFGDDRIDTWAQVIDKRTYRFPNPLYNFEHTLAALKHHFNDLPVYGKILFVGDCSFPTGQPMGALLIDDLEKHQHQIETNEIDEHSKELWDKFAQTCEHTRHKKIELPGDKQLNRRLTISIALLTLAGLWISLLITN